MKYEDEQVVRGVKCGCVRCGGCGGSTLRRVQAADSRVSTTE